MTFLGLSKEKDFVSILPPHDDPRAVLVGRGKLAVEALQHGGIDLLLAGHYHKGYSGDARKHYTKLKSSIIVAQAGTAISRRTRGERNSYNRILLEMPRLSFHRHAWDGDKFALTTTS
jgi:hypothetical protein